MNKLEAVIRKFDVWQRRHRILGFGYAVIKKYGDDEAAYQAALITYYVFLSLFPLLLALTSLLQIVLHGEPDFKVRLIESITHTFPLLGEQLQRNVHGLGKTGLALVVAIVLTTYGARGAADAAQHALNRLWEVPRARRAGFPQNIIKSLSVIGVAGGGLLLSAVLTSYGNGWHGSWVHVLIALASAVIAFSVLLVIFRLAISGKPKFSEVWIGACVAAIGISVLQVAGVYVVSHELKHLDSLYGTFALVLGLLFWIYLQVQVVMCASEIDTVRHFRLWPRSIASPITEQDRQAYALYAAKETFQPNETVRTQFKQTKL